LDGSLLVAENENLAPSEPRMMRAPSRETFGVVLEEGFGFFGAKLIRHIIWRSKRYDIERKVRDRE